MIRYFKPFLAIIILIFSLSLNAAPAKDYWNKWSNFDPVSTQKISYPVWKNFLQKYSTKEDQQVYIKYAKVSKQDKLALKQAIEKLSALHINTYNRNEQYAYWINLYNMETVSLILKNYPVSSITKIKSGYFGFGPWNEKLLTVEGTELSLNDIEHRILRPIWNDPRIHAAVNCASISCPNLLQAPFNAKNINQQLNKSFRAFINSPKGLTIKGETLELSEIFKWYAVDFGDNNQDLKTFITYYLPSKALQNKVLSADDITYQKYNWDLNEV